MEGSECKLSDKVDEAVTGRVLVSHWQSLFVSRVGETLKGTMSVTIGAYTSTDRTPHLGSPVPSRDSSRSSPRGQLHRDQSLASSFGAFEKKKVDSEEYSHTYYMVFEVLYPGHSTTLGRPSSLKAQRYFCAQSMRIFNFVWV